MVVVRRVLPVLVASLPLLGLTGPPAAAGSPTELVSVDVVPATAGVPTGFLTLTARVALRDDDGLADRIAPATIDTPHAVVATDPGREEVLGWPVLTRVSGTARDGVWAGSVEVTPHWAGRTYTVSSVHAVDQTGRRADLPVTDGASVTIEGQPNWVIVPDSAPVRVVTGAERWTPRLAVIDRATGAPVAGAGIEVRDVFAPTPARLDDPPEAFTTSSGRWAAPGSVSVTDPDPPFYLAYGRRGSRGWSLEARRCLDVVVKAQANSRYSALTLPAGERLTVTGNAWPAPAIHPRGAGNVHLQRRTADGGWQTVATSAVRHNGRYTLTWTPQEPGTHALRVRRPGADGDCGGTVGTNLVAVPVTVT